MHKKQQQLRLTAVVLVVVLTLASGVFLSTPFARHWHWIGCYLASVNLVTWLVFIYDKRIAGKPNVVRVPENAMFLLAVAGGLPSTLLAMRVVRHKRAKAAFKWKLFVWFVLVYSVVGAVGWFLKDRFAL